MSETQRQVEEIEVIAGRNLNTMHFLSSIDRIRQLDFSPHWPSRPYVLDVNNIKYDPSGFPKTQTFVKFVTNEDSALEFKEHYSTKSMSSTDSIFSPISFYPTPYSSTFGITKYLREFCSFCNGTKFYEYEILQDSPSINTDGINAIEDQITKQRKPCPFCEKLEDKVEKLYHSASPNEATPPYIIASGDDLQIISQISSIGNVSAKGVPIINYSTLNPFVMMTGEFSNFQNRQSGDLTAHTIDLVSYGMFPPSTGEDLRSIFSNDVYKAYQEADKSLLNWHSFIKEQLPSIPDLNISGRLNNVRSIALRGPVMLHSWGYDIEGYPVPNASGEPLIENGQVVYDKENNIIGKNQQRTRGANGQEEWTDPYKENTFYKGWAQSPGTWPVGPIDFRWDSYAGVWTVGANYKPVFVALEEDLVTSQPVRGSIVESAIDTDPLPDGLRKLVFVRDSLGVFSAPRGAALYCKYDSKNGFYEPIQKDFFVTSGIIDSTNTATLYKIFSPIPNYTELDLSDLPEVETYQTEYQNPLQYKISPGDLALFGFVGTGWILQSVNSCE